MISLGSEAMTITVDPSHGGEILSLVPSHLGQDLLGHPPFRAGRPLAGDLDEGSWTASYRGGWQLAAPNAGAECVVGGTRHGFHGAASVDPWSVMELHHDRVILAWSGHGVTMTRQIRVDGLSVHVDLEWTAAGRNAAPLVVVEHIALGPALLDPEVEIRTDADARELSPSGAPEPHIGESTRWPQVRLLDGGVENVGRWPLSVAHGRLVALTGFTTGIAEVRNPSRQLGVRLEWPTRTLPAAWVWHENRHRGGIWEHRSELLGFEPAAVAHPRGLAEAVAADEATWAHPGQHDGYRVSLSVTGAARGA